MSHFTNLKTSFKNLLHLENALNKLNIVYKREKKLIESNNSKLYNINFRFLVNIMRLNKISEYFIFNVVFNKYTHFLYCNYKL